jgi:outer membrane protein OmpA-like peptidoglycan-associated protein
MSLRSRVAILALAALLAAGVSQADPPETHFYITPFGGYLLFDHDFKFAGGHQLENAPYVGGRLGVQLNHWLAIEGSGGFASTELDTAVGPKIKFTDVAGNLVLTPWATSRGGIFISEGFGWGRLKEEGGAKDSDLDMGLLNSAAGVMVNITDHIGIRLEGRHLFWIPKTDIKDAHIGHWLVGGGLTFNIGGVSKVDSDQDGVPDKKDKCPNTPLGARVDADGCPLDADGDAVPDGIDQCPNTPKGCHVDAHGCPLDSDGDGVCDGLDRCEGTPRGCTVDRNGCPLDADGDGVCDGLDQCANTPHGTQVDEHGCPVVTDSDGDGVPDDKDECPNTPAGLKVDATGCPIEVRETETQLMDTGMIRLEDVHFETAKWDIAPSDTPRLDIVGQVLERWPTLRIEIGGHCDSRGSDAYNQSLSQKRVNSVLDYLLTKFPALKREQYTAVGYGERRPIAPNNNATNMARNRRVEFKVLNRDVLKKEVERRRLLKKNEGTPADTTSH